MKTCKHLDLFSGIGGFALAARNVGWETVGFCEIDPYCQKVLSKHWPDVPIYEDVKDVTAERLKADGITDISIISGGFPCQDISHAGKQAGIEGERSGLWTELARIIGEVRPTYAVLENVSALLSGDRGRWFQRVLGDLAEIGFDAEWHCIPAASVGAPHRRDRVWIIAYPSSTDSGNDQTRGRRGRAQAESEAVQQENRQAYASDAGSIRETVADTKSILPSKSWGTWARRQGLGDGSLCETNWRHSDNWLAEPDVGRVANGIPRELDGFDVTDGYKLLLTYANQTLSDPREILPALRSEINSTAFQEWSTGSTDHVRSKEVLLVYLRELKKRCDEELPPQKGKEVSEECLRILRDHKKSTSASHRPGLSEQHKKEYPDSLQALSRLLAQDCHKAWSPYRGTYATDRVNRLRGLGNAIVPQVAEVIFRSIDENL